MTTMQIRSSDQINPAPGAGGGGGTPTGRLTLTSGTPVTTADVQGATTIYYTPYVGNTILLWDGANWTSYTYTEITIALGTLTNALPYDIFAFQSSGTVTIDPPLAWTNGTTRATAVTLQDGRYCKSGDKTRLYLGTFYTTATTTTEDSNKNRLLFNMYNRIQRMIQMAEQATTVTWTYGTATVRPWNNNTNNRVAVMCGIADSRVRLVFNAQVDISNSGAGARDAEVGIGEDSTTVVSSNCFGRYVGQFTGLSTAATDATLAAVSHLIVYPAIGYHYYQALENAPAGATVTFYGGTSSNTFLEGLTGEFNA